MSTNINVVKEEIRNAVITILSKDAGITEQKIMDAFNRLCCYIEKLIFYTSRPQNAEVLHAGVLYALLRVMDNHTSNMRTIRRGGKAIKYYQLAYSTQFYKTFLAKSGVQVIAKIMQRHAKNDSVVSFACVLLEEMMTADVMSAVDFIRYGGLEAMIVVKMQKESNDSVQSLASCIEKILAADNDAVATSIVSSGMIDARLAILLDSTEHCRLLHIHVNFLRYLVRNILIGTSMVQKGGIDAILSLMDHHSDEKLIQESCYQVLGVVKFCNDSVAAATINSGVIDRIIAVLQENIEHRGMVHIRLKALGFLASSAGVACCTMQKGGLKAALRVMEYHSASKLIQEGGYQFLGKLEPCDDSVAVAIVNSGVIDTAIKTLQDNSEVGTIVCHQLHVLCYLAASRPHVACCIVKKGGLMASICAMEQHSTDNLIQGIGFQFLAKIKKNCDNFVATAIIESRVIDWIILCLCQKIEDVTTVQTRLNVLCHLVASFTTVKCYTVQKGGLKAAIDAMEQHLSDVLIQERGYQFLDSLEYCDDAVAAAVVNSGVIEWIIECLSDKIEKGATVQARITVLRYLAASNSTVTCYMVRKGCVVALLCAMEQHSFDELVQNAGNQFLEILMYCEDSAAAFNINSGLIEEILATSRIYQQSNEEFTVKTRNLLALQLVLWWHLS